MMEWGDAITEAKKELEINSYTDDWEEVTALAHDILSEEARRKHQAYLKSNKWKQHSDFIKSLTIKPNIWLNNEVNKGVDNGKKEP